MNVAIVGSREFNDYPTMDKAVESKELSIKSIISGGATGADTLAERYAKEHGLSLIVKYPDWATHGKRAGSLRNAEIVSLADVVFAFRINNSPGTTITINMARQKKIPVYVYDC